MRRSSRLMLASAVVVGLAGGCNQDDVEDLGCPAPDDAFELSECLREQLDIDRGDEDLTFKVDLYRLTNGEYRYALLPSSIRAPIRVYDACCTLDCSLGIPGAGCEWLDDAEDLGTIFEE